MAPSARSMGAAAAAGGSSRSMLSSTKDAASRAPFAGGTAALGTRTTAIPAARPARTPLSESSTTRQRSGAIPIRAAARR